MLTFFSTSKSLKKKLQQLQGRLEKLINDPGFSIETLPVFFNTIEEEIQKLTEKELHKAGPSLGRFIKNTGRDKYGFFRAPEGEKATNANTWVGLNIPLEEYFPDMTIVDILKKKDDIINMPGVLSRPMTYMQLFFGHKAKSFMQENYKFLCSITSNL